MNRLLAVRAVCFDWGGTLMSEDGPAGLPMAQWEQVQIIDGALECVAALAARLPLAITTNATVSRRPMIETALARVGLHQYFQHIYCFTELGRRKGEPEFWSAVSSGLNAPLPHIAMIGDSLEQDVLLPRSFGVQAVWFNPTSVAAPMAANIPQVQHLATFQSWVERAAASSKASR